MDGPTLKDIHLPAEIGFWPPAIGWWLIAAALLILLILAGYFLLHFFSKKRYLNHIEHVLATEKDPKRLASLCSQLLRRTAIKAYPDKQVHGMTDNTWLNFLDSTGNCQDFTEGPGKGLVLLPYQERISHYDTEELVAITIRWIRKHL